MNGGLKRNQQILSKVSQEKKFNFKFHPNAAPNPDAPNMLSSSIYIAFHNLFSLKISTKYGKKSINTAKKWEIRMILVLGLKP